MRSAKSVETRPDRWTVVIFNKRHKPIGVWTGVTGATADAAIRHCWIHNVPKADRLYVCESVAYRQSDAEVRHLRPELEMVIEKSGTGESGPDQGNVRRGSGKGSRPQAGGEPDPDNPPTYAALIRIVDETAPLRAEAERTLHDVLAEDWLSPGDDHWDEA